MASDKGTARSIQRLEVQGGGSYASTIPAGFLAKESNSSSGAYDLGELDQALFLYLEGHNTHPSVADQRHCTEIRPPTLNIFPSQPMHVDPLLKGVGLGSSSGDRNNNTNNSNNSSSSNIQLGFDSPTSSSGVSNKRSSSEQQHQQQSTMMMELANPRTDLTSKPPEPDKVSKRESIRKGAASSSEHEGPKTPDPKTLRRLAQNREAARKSRLRKKAYVQQLESSRMKLNQLEHELQRARAQGMFFGGSGMLGDQSLPCGSGNLSTEAAVFDMEYGRWLEEHHRLMCELRAAVSEHLPESELRLYVDNCLGHYEEMMGLKSMVARADVFHLVSGIWKTPAERCFLWMGGFRPSDLLKMLVPQIEPLTEQQFLAMCSLQQSSQQAEDALTQGIEALHKSLSETIASGSLTTPTIMANYMGQMALAMNKLANLEGFVRQADNLRHQTLQQLHRILTTRQAARCFLAIGEYFHRLRALSSLWLARPKQE
ncbi:bZIP transcription factor TGA10 isoform X1 [Amborella trichopoda]|uniref:BZIP domain-containing protein n=2 Tax=Amborella trichopoda TaxID=13333 RepID=W1PNT9_AMBTC|nr:bZIP transcription factor TGA10 isoform X1 [Amborella trichopoda]ERN11662.1 hypothetical protein AMTR_s00022p00217850 [Amborella trichopoda]|eukprot:XP_020526256.1 bZIP transcription factor TGA10 isoform X1 [Amborella trichopoda]